MNFIKNNRATSFLVMFIIYVVVTICGIICYKYLPFEFYINLLLADIIATVATFIFSLIFKNASVYDPYWSVQPMVIITLYAFYYKIENMSQILIMIIIFIWGIRLTANWAYTFHGLKYQDWRYTMLKENTKKFYPLINFIGIHLIPTLIVYGCTLPAVFILKYSTKFNVGFFLFFMLSLVAVITQGISDYQMHKYRKNRTSTFIRTGLWKYSRHPNYLGEILMWWGVSLACVCVLPQYWFLLIGAFANTLLFLFVSIPMADKRQSRKEGFDQYRKETRMLLPIKK